MYKILVVEDDEQQNRTVTSFLLRQGYQAVGVIDVNEAYDAMYDTQFDIIITDIMMAPVDGFEFADAIRSSDANIPIIFVSARDDYSAKARGFQIGIDDFIEYSTCLAPTEYS